MGTEYHLSHNLEILAQELRRKIRTDCRERLDPFYSPMVLIPNRNLRRWLQMQMARSDNDPDLPPEAKGIQANTDFRFLERGLLEQLRRLDGSPRQPEILDRQRLQQRIMGILWKDSPGRGELAPFHAYLDRVERGSASGEERERNQADLPGDLPGTPRQRLRHTLRYQRRLYHLSTRLAGILLDYEYHRNGLVSSWTGDPPMDHWYGSRELEFPEDLEEMHEAQRHLYRLATIEWKGEGPTETLARYATRVMDGIDERGSALKESVHLFGISQISRFHLSLLRRLGQHLTIRYYLLDLHPESSASPSPLMDLWGVPGRELFQLLESAGSGEEQWFIHGESGSRIRSKEVKSEVRYTQTLLGRLQNAVLNGTPSSPGRGEERSSQDATIQIAGAPGLYREVESIHQNILYNLKRDETLRLTDIAILVNDMATYRPVLLSVFERDRDGESGRPRLPYNLTDFSAGEASLFADGIRALLDLPDSHVTRGDLFHLIYNPCLLSAAGIAREEADLWLGWADRLGVFRDFSAEERAAKGGPPDALYTWEQALRRLRLGRIMESPRGEDDFRQWNGIVPHDDSDVRDGESVGRLSLFLQSLNDAIDPLRSREEKGALHSAGEWREILGNLADRFLAVPEDRNEESRVREAFFASLASLEDLAPAFDDSIPFGIVKEQILEELMEIPANRGQYLAGGITIAALQPMRPIPFRIVYLPGMGEGEFPGREDRSRLNLQNVHRLVGDTTLPQINRFLFLENLMSVQDRLYITYVSRNIQKDSELEPCSVVNELTNYLNNHLLLKKFQKQRLPLRLADCEIELLRLEEPSRKTENSFASPAKSLTSGDMLFHYSGPDWLATLLRNREILPGETRSVRLKLSKAQESELEQKERSLRHDTLRSREAPPSGTGMQPARMTEPARVKVRLQELREFLVSPLEALLKLRANIRDEEFQDLSLPSDEPFYTIHPLKGDLMRSALRQWIDLSIDSAAQSMKSMKEDKVRAKEGHIAEEPRSMAHLHEILDPIYTNHLQRSELPRGVYGELDRDLLLQGLRSRTEPLQEHLVSRGGWIRGPVLGEENRREQCELRMEPLLLEIENPRKEGESFQVSLHGSVEYLRPLTGGDAGSHDIIVVTSSSLNSGSESPFLLPFLFYLATVATGHLDETNPCTVIATVSGDNKKGIRTFHAKQSEAKEYLTNLVRDYLFAPYHNLPLALIEHRDVELYPHRRIKEKNSRDSIRKDEGAGALGAGTDHDIAIDAVNALDTIDASAYRERLEGVWWESGQGLLSSETALLAKADIPEDALEIAKRRWQLYFREAAK